MVVNCCGILLFRKQLCSPSSFLNYLLSGVHHGSLVAVGETPNWPVHEWHVLVEKVLLGGRLWDLFHLVSKPLCLYMQRQLIAEPVKKPKCLTWDSSNLISNLFWLCSCEESASLHKPFSVWEKRCPNPARHEAGVWMVSLLAVSSEARYHLQGPTRSPCTVLSLSYSLPRAHPCLYHQEPL